MIIKYNVLARHLLRIVETGLRPADVPAPQACGGLEGPLLRNEANFEAVGTQAKGGALTDMEP